MVWPFFLGKYLINKLSCVSSKTTEDFNSSSKGFLVDITCAFGAQVLVCKERSTGKGESLIMMKDVVAYKHVWEIKNFSKLESECYDSKPFNAGKYKWYK